MRILLASLLLVSVPAFADPEPVSEQNTRTYYNSTERQTWSEPPRTEGEVTGVDSRDDDDVKVRPFYLLPFVGAEITTVGASFYRGPDGTLTGQIAPTDVYGAPAFGAVAGVRLGGLSLGVRYQGSIYTDPSLNRLNLNKVYGEAGFNVRNGRALFVGYLGGGYAFAVTRDALANGIGSKAGFGVDFLLTRFMSIGPAIEFDLQAYRAPQNWVVAYGGTGIVRIGLHL